MAGVGGVCYVLEGDRAFHIFSGKYSLVLPFHEDLDVGGHGGAVSASACGPTRASGDELDRWRGDKAGEYFGDSQG